MDNKTKGIIGTIASVILCGCPGLFMCIFGAVSATGNMPYSTEVNGVSNSGTVSPTVGLVLLCLSVIFILIPVAVGFFTLRPKPAAIDESLPPSS
jgi:hypothetical protein